MSTGAEYLGAVFGAGAQEECLSDELLREYADRTLDPVKRGRADVHLAECQSCTDRLAEQLAEVYEREGDSWWSEYVGRQVLGVLVRVPEEIDGVREALGYPDSVEVKSQQIITLPLLEPSEGVAERLAAATGEGLSEQRLHQDEPPFDFHLVAFGEQLRIGIRPTKKNSPYEECLGRLEVSEEGERRHSEYVLIDKGEGQIVLDPSKVRGLRPERERVTLKFVPVFTLSELAAAGTEAYKPIFVRLLGHEDPQIRRSAVVVVGRIYGPGAASLVRPLADDEDERVRSEVKKVIGRFPQ
jgi:hypothetical protein